MAENEWVTGVITLWGYDLSLFFVVAFQTSKLCANPTDGSRKIETNTKITVCRDLSMHKLAAFMWQNWSNLEQFFLGGGFSSLIWKLQSKRDHFSPKKCCETKQPWNYDLGTCKLCGLILLMTPGIRKTNIRKRFISVVPATIRSGMVTANHGYQEAHSQLFSTGWG